MDPQARLPRLPGGHGYTDFEPSRLDQERNVEVRTCDGCGATVETEPYFTTRPKQGNHHGPHLASPTEARGGASRQMRRTS
jgi:hypothetical protein